MSENLELLKSYLGGEGGGSHFVKKSERQMPGGARVVLTPHRVPLGQRPKLVVVPLLDHEDETYAWDKMNSQ